MATSLGYQLIDRTPLDVPESLCATSIGGLDGTEWNLKGYLLPSCIICKGV